VLALKVATLAMGDLHVTGLKFSKDFFEYRKYFIRQSGDRN
jgi:hypothetical protein